jgi:hypothetical protein
MNRGRNGNEKEVEMKRGQKEKGLRILLRGKKLLLEAHLEFDRGKIGYIFILFVILLTIWASSLSYEMRRLILDFLLCIFGVLTA